MYEEPRSRVDTREIMMLSANLWRVITDRKEEVSPEDKDTRNGVGFFFLCPFIHLFVHQYCLSLALCWA